MCVVGERKTRNDVRLPFERPSERESTSVLEFDDVRGIIKLQGLVFARRAGGSRTRQQCLGEWICTGGVSDLDQILSGFALSYQSPQFGRVVVAVRRYGAYGSGSCPSYR